MYIITKADIQLLFQRSKDLYIQCILLNENENPIGELNSIVTDGSYTIDADSDIRRTSSLTVNMSKMKKEFEEKQYFTHFIDLRIGFYSLYVKDIIYYNIGRFLFDQASYDYDATTNNLELSMVDKMGMLDSDHRGILYGASSTVIKALNDDGTRIKADDKSKIELGHVSYDNTIRNAMIAVLKQANISNYIFHDELGAYSVVKGIQSAEDFYQCSGSITTTYDDEGEIIKTTDSRYEYNELPYNLEFSLGDSILTEIQELRDLYDNYETYFDVNGVFHCGMIPSCNEDSVFLDANTFQKCVISESYSNNIYDVKNIVEVWGKELDVDYYSSFPEYLRHDGTAEENTDCYTVSIKNFQSKTTQGSYVYADGLVVGVKFTSSQDNFPETNSNDIVKLQIIPLDDDGNVLEEQQYPSAYVYDPINSNNYLGKEMLETGVTYLFQWSTSKDGWYFLGQYQVHAVAVLTNGNTTVQEISEKFNCSKNAVYLDVEPDSPYVVEEIGDVVTIMSDGDYANIASDAAAKSSASYELWKTARRQETITLQTILIPFLDVNVKVQYTKHGDTEPTTYIVKSINADLTSGTMSVEMMTFYSLYKN